MNYTIYTDGSDLKHTTHRMGVGGILVDTAQGKILDQFSEEIPLKYLKLRYGTTDCSNPTAEMIAVRRALEIWSRKFKPGDHIDMYQDYLGVSEWLQGTWKAKKSYIKDLTDEIHEAIRKLRIHIDWHWVKAHQARRGASQEAIYNDLVDRLAKGKGDGKI